MRGCNPIASICMHKPSEEITFILELKVIGESKAEVEKFTQYLGDFIVEREPSTVYGYFISEDGEKVTLIERYNNSQDGIQHGKDFVNGPNFEKFFDMEVSMFSCLILKKFNYAC